MLHESERSFGGSFDIEPQADGIGAQGVVDDGQQWRELGLVEADERAAVEMGLGIEPVDGEEDGDGGDALRAEHHLVPTGLQVHEDGRALRQLRSDAARGGGIEVGEPERGLVGRPRRGVGLLDAVDRRPGGSTLSPMARRVGEGKAQCLAVGEPGGAQSVAGGDEAPHHLGSFCGKRIGRLRVEVVDLGYLGGWRHPRPVRVDRLQPSRIDGIGDEPIQGFVREVRRGRR